MQIVLFDKLRDRSSCAHITAVDFGGKISFFVRSFPITCTVFDIAIDKTQTTPSQINQPQVNNHKLTNRQSQVN